MFLKMQEIQSCFYKIRYSHHSASFFFFFLFYSKEYKLLKCRKKRNSSPLHSPKLGLFWLWKKIFLVTNNPYVIRVTYQRANIDPLGLFLCIQGHPTCPTDMIGELQLDHHSSELPKSFQRSLDLFYPWATCLQREVPVSSEKTQRKKAIPYSNKNISLSIVQEPFEFIYCRKRFFLHMCFLNIAFTY